MAIVNNNPYPEIADYFGQYQNWKQVKLPSGEVVYEVPGHPERVFIPSLSNASGRVVLRPNPTKDIAAQQEQEDRIKQEQEQVAFNRSPAGQLLPVFGGVAGTVGAIKLADYLKNGSGAATRVMMPSGQIVDLPAATGGADAAAAASQVTNGAALAPGVSNGAAAAQGAQAVAPVESALPVIATEGSGVASSIIPGMTTDASLPVPELISASRIPGATAPLGPMNYVGGGLGLGLGGYQAYEGLTKGNPLQAGLGGVGMGLGLNALGVSLGPAGWAAMAALPIAAKFGLFDHETTREKTAKNTQQLAKAAPEDSVYQNYVSGMREQFKEAPKGNPFHGGDYASWDEYKQAGLDPTDLTGVYGNIKTFGPEWAHLTEPQRLAVTQKIIDADLYTTNKGDVEIKDPQKAKEIYDSVKTGFNAGVNTATNGQAAANGAQGQPIVVTGNPNINTTGLNLKRSSTLRPGIGMNGQRITY